MRQIVELERNALVGQSSLEPVQRSATSHPPAASLRHTVVEGSRRSAGHAALEPLQTSARSQTPRCARHSVPAARKVSAGHVVPEQISSRSQTPADARHTVPAGAGPDATHAPLGHSRRPTSHGFPVVQGAPGTQALEHAPRPSHEPALHAVPSGWNPLGGHEGPPVVHRSATSHSPAEGRQIVVDAASASGGQLGLPSHRSSGSHGPVLARQTSPAGRPAQVTVPQSAAHTPLQHISPAPQVLARSHRPATHVALSHGPAAQVVALHAGRQPVVGSAAGSPGTHADSGQAASRAAKRQRPSGSQRSSVHAMPSSQSSSMLQSGGGPASGRGPASRPASLPGPASIAPASMGRGRATQPRPGTQT
jgi:hypothetical protein